MPDTNNFETTLEIEREGYEAPYSSTGRDTIVSFNDTEFSHQMKTYVFRIS